jgi:monofunctional biosynthetic peptidoglycan transglycosylase
MKKIWRFLKKAFLFCFISSLVYLLICRFLFPPITITQLGDSFSYGLKREYVSWNQISRNVKLAAIASEDQTFPDHNGFDLNAIQKSLNPKKKNKKKKLPLGAGASTITQQTAKNVFLWQGSGPMRYLRKIPEAYFTLLIEWIWGKQRILEVYLNVIEMGPGIFGIEAAAQHYYGKHAKDLSRAEAASIIACLPNPKRFQVKPASRFVAWKQQWIMRQMNQLEGDEDLEAILKK